MTGRWSESHAVFDELLKLLSEMGCEVSRRGKAIRLKAPVWKNIARFTGGGDFAKGGNGCTEDDG